MSASNFRRRDGQKNKRTEAGVIDPSEGLNDPSEGLYRDDPLDIDKAVATRKAMSLGKRVGITRLFVNQRSLTKKAGILARYLKCRRGPGRLTIEEFLKFGLARTGQKFRKNELQAFVGHIVQQKMHDACNDQSWFATTKNKQLWQMIVSGGGLSVPITLAIYDIKGRGGGARVLENERALKEFLSQVSNIPVFCKPVTGTYSIGAFRIDEFDGETALINGHWRKSVGDIAHYFSTIGKKGYLLQQPLKPSQKLLPVTGSSIATLRIFLRMDSGTPAIIRAVLKLPAKGEVADNFWRPDAQLWAIDTLSGAVIRKVCNNPLVGTPQRIDDLNTFPPAGFKLPDFQQSLELVFKAAVLFPAIRTQSWDIAITDRGPVLMELNFGGDLGLVQMAHGKGILEEKEYCEHLRVCGYPGKLPG